MASVTVIFGGQEQKTFTIDRRMVVGRDATCEIHIDNLGISRQHCAFAPKGDAFMVQDLGSSNGTYVNGRKVTEHFLNDADEVVIGKYTLKFNNETQQKVAPKTDTGSPVPDTLNTYVMDGQKIQEQLAKMRAGQPGAGGSSSPDHAPAAVPSTAKDYAKALDVAPAGGTGGGAKVMIIALIGVVFLLIVAVVALLFFLKKP